MKDSKVSQGLDSAIPTRRTLPTRRRSAAGDRRAASEGCATGGSEQVLMGVTGSGKTFTMANVIQAVQRPTLVLSHNKTLAAQLYSEFKEFFPHNAVALLRQLLRLLPARSVHPAARHLHRKRRLDQRGDRPPAAGRDQRPGQPPRRDHRRQRVVHLRLGLAGRLPRDDDRPGASASRSIATHAAASWSISSTSGTTSSFPHGKFRVRGDCVEALAELRGIRLSRSSSGATRSSSFRSSIRPAAK